MLPFLANYFAECFSVQFLRISHTALTFNPCIQFFLFQLLGSGELAKCYFRCAVTLADRANHLLLFLVVNLSIYVYPWNFSYKKYKNTNDAKNKSKRDTVKGYRDTVKKDKEIQ